MLRWETDLSEVERQWHTTNNTLVTLHVSGTGDAFNDWKAWVKEAVTDMPEYPHDKFVFIIAECIDPHRRNIIDCPFFLSIDV